MQICAPSNAAVDEVLLRLCKEGLLPTEHRQASGAPDARAKPSARSLLRLGVSDRCAPATPALSAAPRARGDSVLSEFTPSVSLTINSAPSYWHSPTDHAGAACGGSTRGLFRAYGHFFPQRRRLLRRLHSAEDILLRLLDNSHVDPVWRQAGYNLDHHGEF